MSLDLVAMTRFRKLTDTRGSRETLTCSALVEKLSRPHTYQPSQLERDDRDVTKWKKPRDLPGYSLATFRKEHRALVDVENVYALTLDYDDGKTEVATAAELWKGIRGVILSSFNTTAAHPRFRVHLFLSRAVTSVEHEALWLWANVRASAAGQKLDPAPKDASRFWYAPAIVEGERFDFLQL